VTQSRAFSIYYRVEDGRQDGLTNELARGLLIQGYKSENGNVCRWVEGM
jgi:hypothetical protein